MMELTDPISDEAIQSIIDELIFGERLEAHLLLETENAGIYAYFLKPEAVLPGLTLGETRLLYVGMTESSLKERNHFLHSDSSFSSPRRSFGALLKEELRIKAVPRGRGMTAKDFCNYRFVADEEDGENKLSAWMKKNLTYRAVAIRGPLKEIEGRVIQRLSPPLNLTKSKNISFDLRKARKLCRNEAKLSTTL